MFRVVIDTMEPNDASAGEVGYVMALEVDGRTIMSSTSQSYSNVHDPIEIAERAFGYGAGTSATGGPTTPTPDPAMEPVELVIKYLHRPTETRRLR